MSTELTATMAGERMTRVARRGEAGFSLIELMIAVVITGIVSLSIYALMAQGQGAFKREPALTDRQQNARIAIDLIEGDIVNAGRGLPLVAQVFTDALSGVGPVGARGVNTDEFELVLADPACPSQNVCTGAGVAAAPSLGNVGGAGVYSTSELVGPDTCLNPAPGDPRPLVLLASQFNFTVHPSTVVGGPSATGCWGSLGAPALNGSMTLDAALPGIGGWPGGGGGAPVSPLTMYAAYVVRYRLVDTNGDGVSDDLQRSEKGGGPAANWQVVARGIDDMLVEYMNAGGAWTATPGAVPACAAATCTVAEVDAVVRNVRVTLSARTVDEHVLGAGPDLEFRGQVTTIATPRSAVAALEWATKTVTGSPVFN